MQSLACPSAPSEPRGFWLRESTDGCESCNEPDHEKLCATCAARLCSGCAKRCECDSYHCASCLFRHEDMELCLTCFKNAKEEKAMVPMKWSRADSSDHYYRSDLGYEIHFASLVIKTKPETHYSACVLFDPNGACECTRDTVTELERIADTLVLKLRAEGQPQPVVALLESVEDSAVSA